MKQLKGIITPLVTPLATVNTVDVCGVQRMVDFVINGGVSGIFPLGSTGEGAAMTLPMRKRMLELTVRFTAGRVPVLAGITNASMLESLEFGRYAMEIGCDALVVSPPCFLPPDERELLAYYQAFDALGAPLCIYNMPALTGTDLAPELLATLAKLDHVIAIKDSAGNFEAFKKTLKLLGPKRKISMLMGPEAMTYDALKIGADGGVNSGSNLRPDLFCGLYQSFIAGDENRMNEYQKQILEFENIYGTPVTTSSVIRGLKYGLSKAGLISNLYVPPFVA